ncbi:MAG: hypothetical protein KDC88_05265 [Ignavibacteriae bacterium]|nr:hypothetical protein [Ignavibacteriota bacterium]MCB9208441.1 hypothetical protein [Ignavibacteriales bacterium]MCB9258451.1 hypothetical protein [Ignavibacteriales bacterium]
MRNFKRYSLLLFLIFIISNNAKIFAQDSVNTVEKTSQYKLSLNNDPYTKSPLFILKQPILIDEFSEFIIPETIEYGNEKTFSSMQLRQEINSAMQIYRQGFIKNDLGVVGEILGYTNAAAALGLAIYHVSKYKKYYGIK